MRVLFALLVACGCSAKPDFVPTISPIVDGDAASERVTDGGVAISDASPSAHDASPSACKQPWEDGGFDATYAIANKIYFVKSGSYIAFTPATNSWDAGWKQLSTAWSAAPPIDGVQPAAAPITTSYYYADRYQTVISGDHFWTLDVPANTWSTGSLASAWGGAPATGDGKKPWQDLRASYVYNGTQTMIAGDRFWLYNTATFAWTAPGLLSQAWKAAPLINGSEPWEGGGVDTSYICQDVQIIISGDRYWSYDIKAAYWAGGKLPFLWGTAPPCRN